MHSLYRDQKKSQWEPCKTVLGALRAFLSVFSSTELVYIISLIYKEAFRQFHTAFLSCSPQKTCKPKGLVATWRENSVKLHHEPKRCSCLDALFPWAPAVNETYLSGPGHSHTARSAALCYRSPGIAQSQGAAESVMTCIVETHRSSLSKNENLNLFLHFSVDSGKQSCVINKMFIPAVLLS